MKKPPPQARGGKREGAGRPTNWVRTQCATIIDKSRLFAELARIASHGEKESDRLRAIEMLVDRAYGKAQQTVEVNGAVAVNWTVKVQAA